MVGVTTGTFGCGENEGRQSERSTNSPFLIFRITFASRAGSRSAGLETKVLVEVCTRGFVALRPRDANAVARKSSSTSVSLSESDDVSCCSSSISRTSARSVPCLGVLFEICVKIFGSNDSHVFSINDLIFDSLKLTPESASISLVENCTVSSDVDCCFRFFCFGTFFIGEAFFRFPKTAACTKFSTAFSLAFVCRELFLPLLEDKLVELISKLFSCATRKYYELRLIRKHTQERAPSTTRDNDEWTWRALT